MWVNSKNVTCRSIIQRISLVIHDEIVGVLVGSNFPSFTLFAINDEQLFTKENLLWKNFQTNKIFPQKNFIATNQKKIGVLYRNHHYLW